MHSIGIGLDYLARRHDAVEVSATLPGVMEIEDAFYVPEYDCLFDAHGDLIIESCCDYTEKKDILFRWAKPPEKIDVKSYEFDEINESCIFGSSIYKLYGHFITDDISRLWYYFNSSRGQKLFLSVSDGLEASWIRDLLALSGVRTKDILTSSTPLHFKNIHVPIPSFQVPTKIYKCHSIFFDNVIHTLKNQGAIKATDKNYYLSRSRLSDLHRKITNEGEFEAFISEQGYEVVYPEEMGIVDQIEIFNTSGKILLCEGSAAHTALFSGSGMTLGVLGPKPNNWRFYMIDKIKSYNSYYFKTNKKDYSQKAVDEALWPRLQDQRIIMELAKPFLRDAGFIA